MPMISTVAMIRLTRTAGGSSGALRRTPKVAAGVSSAITVTPTFQHIDQHEHEERDGQQHDGDGRRLAVTELFERRDDEHRRDFRLERHVARYKDDRPVLSEPTRERQCKPGDDGREQTRDD